MIIKAIIFDLDGTLLDTLADLTDSTNYALSKFNYPTRSIEEIKSFVGNGVRKLFERAVPGKDECVDLDLVINLFKNHYSDNMYNKTLPYVGVIELLKELKKRDIRIAIVSNKFDKAVKQLSDKYFGKLVDLAIGEDEVRGIRKKPFPDGLLSVLQYFEISNNEAIYVGDSEVDIETANNVGVCCVSVTWGFKSEKFLKQNGAKNLVNNPNEILKLL